MSNPIPPEGSASVALAQRRRRCQGRVVGAERQAAERTRALRARARELGFQRVGVAPAGPIDPEGRLRAWLARGAHGGMDYMARGVAEREDVTAYLPGARSVVALALSYHHPDYTPERPLAVSRYAVGDDYHGIIRKKLRKLRKLLLELDPEARVAPTVDTSPMLERAWAERAGVAWIGKSTMAIARDLGTYTFLATLITTSELEYDAPHLDHCGSCTRCLDACPTGAFDGPYQLDATRCITHWTVEERGPFDERTVDLHGWIAGCDVCQEVCPWNKFARPTEEPRFAPRPGLTSPDPTLFTDPERRDELVTLLQGTALQRTGAEALARNARRAMEERERPTAPEEPAPPTSSEP